jgi:UDP-N-acetyl-D-glucosamine dehydrogenase
MQSFKRIAQKAETGALTVAVIGLGYVGLPLALALAEAGVTVIGVDIDPSKIDHLKSGKSYLSTALPQRIAAAIAAGRLTATTNHSAVAEADATLIAVPTPLGPGRTPDMQFVERTVKEIAPHLANGSLLSLESTVYPGATRACVLPLLEIAGRQPGVDILVAYAPEREDPGNSDYSIKDIPKILAGLDTASLEAARAVYRLISPSLREVSSLEAAEAVKITENVFRAVNIALVNELKDIYGRMSVDIFEVIDAAATKPFGYMPFYPGPGLGGHCIPIDPFYLSWRARELNTPARFVELAGEINSRQPKAVVQALQGALNLNGGKALNGASVLIVGIAYKKNVNDIRESPGLEVMSLLLKAGAKVDYHDPWTDVIGKTRQYPELSGLASTPLDILNKYEAAVIVTDHDAVDYERLASEIPLIVDSRGVYRDLNKRAAKIVRA